MKAANASRTPSGKATLVGLAIFGLMELFRRRGASVPAMAVAHSVQASAGGVTHSGRAMPSDQEHDAAKTRGDSAPGEPKTGHSDVASGVRAYLIGLGLAALLTAGSFAISYTKLIYVPGVPFALIVFAVAQIGIHLVFFLHLTTSPDNTNNAMALAFGVMILVLLIGGTLWIMGHMNANMMAGQGGGTGALMNMAP